jgi:hypothetical protein
MQFIKVRHKDVISCDQAAQARGIKLKQELKTILLHFNEIKVAVHIRGCDKVNFRSIKKLFKCRNIKFLSQDKLLLYNLSPGKINPWNIDFCEYHLVCLLVLSNSFVATNNSKLSEGIIFRPHLLLGLPNLIIGKFAYERKKASN